MTGPFSSIATEFAAPPTPTDFSDISADIAHFLTFAQGDLADASSAFASGEILTGLIDLTSAGEQFTESSQVGLVGLTEVLFGSM